MKKIICLCLALVMVFGLVACGNDKTNETTPNTPATEATTPSKPDATEGTENETEGETTKTVAETLVDAFKTAATTEGATVETIATTLSTNEMIQFMPMVQAMEPGYLPGFDEEIKNFKECYVMGPAIGSIPFVSYVFTLEDGADVTAFVKTLEDTHNLRWNICVAAEQMLTATEGNFIYFVMSPNAFETETPDEGGMEITPDVETETPVDTETETTVPAENA